MPHISSLRPIVQKLQVLREFEIMFYGNIPEEGFQLVGRFRTPQSYFPQKGTGLVLAPAATRCPEFLSGVLK